MKTIDGNQTRRENLVMDAPREELTERKLAEDFDQVHRKVAEQIREYETTYPDLCPPSPREEVVQQPVYAYEIHAVT